MRCYVLFALFALSLFFNAYQLARDQARPATPLVAVVPATLSSEDLGLLPEQARALDSVRVFAAIRWERREEQRAHVEAQLIDLLQQGAAVPEAVATGLDQYLELDGEFRYRVYAELLKWSDTRTPEQRAELARRLRERDLSALVAQWY